MDSYIKMIINSDNWYFRSGIANCFAIAGVLTAFIDNRAIAQSNIVPDSTLGNESSRVITNYQGDSTELLTGGATRGSNLFHSFKELNVSEGRKALFLSPSNNIQNIITRVTGGNSSQILGTLETSNANLFLINPNGIIFGENATLNIGGSFVASTAEAVNFADGKTFSATATQTEPLLTVNVPLGLQFGKTRGDIQVQGNLEVPLGETMALLGGNIILDNAFLKAESGQIALGAVDDIGTVILNLDDVNQPLSFPNQLEFADVLLKNNTLVDVNGSGGGKVQLQGKKINLSDASEVQAITLGSQDGRGISVRAKQFTVQDGSGVLTTADNEGAGGTISVEASEFVQITGIAINSNGEPFSIPSALSTITFAEGKAGDLSIETGQLIVENGANISSGTRSKGDGGDLTINASNIVKVVGSSNLSGLFTQTQGSGDAGSLTINTQKLIVQDNSVVSAGTQTASRGNGGNLTVNASDSVTLSGTAIGEDDRVFTRGLSAQTQGSGDAKDLNINTPRLIIKDGAVIAGGAAVGSQGNGGNLNINADSIEISGTAPNGKGVSGIFARSRGTGKAGDVNITANDLAIQDGAQITVSGLENGEAGNLKINANTIKLDEGNIFADTSNGDGGNITLQDLDLLLLRRNSLITAEARNQANGGNVTIDATDGFIVAIPPENSDILALASEGKGGNIDITATGIYGLVNRTQQSTDDNISEINATSEFGLNGSVELNTPDIQPETGLTELPSIPIESKLAQGCYEPSYAQSRFVIVGRGGLPTLPEQTLTSDSVRVGWVSPHTENGSRESQEKIQNLKLQSEAQQPQNKNQIVEATGWIVNEKGEIVFTASSNNSSSLQAPVGCE